MARSSSGTGTTSSEKLSRTASPGPSNQMMQKFMAAGGRPVPGTLQRTPTGNNQAGSGSNQSGSNQAGSGNGPGSGTTAAPPAKSSPPAMKPVTVTIPPDIRADSTPKEMKKNRIPPRVNTSVDVHLKGTLDPSMPVNLSIDGQGGGNGEATIDGKATRDLTSSGTTTLHLKGKTQTEPKQDSQLRLVATQNGKQLASSRGFSVSAIPQNMSFSFDNLAKGDFRGIHITYDMLPDSGVRGDLDKAGGAERVEYPTKKPEALKHCYSTLSKTMKDEHKLRTSSLTSRMTIPAKQTFMFKDERTNSEGIPMKNSGFLIKHIVKTKKPGPGLEITTSKEGAAEKAQDRDTVCKSGPIQSDSGTGSESKTQDV